VHHRLDSHATDRDTTSLLPYSLDQLSEDEQYVQVTTTYFHSLCQGARNLCFASPGETDRGSGRKQDSYQAAALHKKLGLLRSSLACHSVPAEDHVTQDTLRPSRLTRNYPMTKAVPRSVWTYVTPFFCYLPIVYPRHRTCRIIGQQSWSLLIPKEAGHNGAKLIVLFGTSSLSRSWPAERQPRLVAMSFGLDLSIEAYRPRDCGVATMHDIPHLFGCEDVEGELDRPSSPCGVAGRNSMP
jgi:hypothetical protein